MKLRYYSDVKPLKDLNDLIELLKRLNHVDNLNKLKDDKYLNIDLLFHYDESFNEVIIETS